jgi:phosphoribosylglycinamide formyltransferase-1
VLSNKADAYGLERAKKANIPTQVINHKDFATREDFDDKLHEIIKSSSAEFICLAGFMRLLTQGFVDKWQSKMINIHPSLLPLFKGMHTHEEALKAGVKTHGCTVHYVVAEMDAGPIILQAEVPVLAGDTPETLGVRVLEQEHKIYPQALKKLVTTA